jgi:hypothetical protein
MMPEVIMQLLEISLQEKDFRKVGTITVSFNF